MEFIPCGLRVPDYRHKTARANPTVQRQDCRHKCWPGSMHRIFHVQKHPHHVFWTEDSFEGKAIMEVFKWAKGRARHRKEENKRIFLQFMWSKKSICVFWALPQCNLIKCVWKSYLKVFWKNFTEMPEGIKSCKHLQVSWSPRMPLACWCCSQICSRAQSASSSLLPKPYQ